MKIIFSILAFITVINPAFANLKYHPIRFALSTDKESYYEGEKITFNITITNTDKEKAYPVLIPHTQNTGQKLFYLTAYDKAKNTTLLRYSEDPMLNMMVHDTGSVKIVYLNPQEQIIVPVYLNDFENYYNYHTQNASHHSFGVPLFAGIYQIRLSYNPNGIALGDSIYNYYNVTNEDLPQNGKEPMPSSGDLSHFCTLKIKRSADTLITIERQKYFIKENGAHYYYFTENVDEITTDQRCVHITSLPADSCTLPGREYFYSQFPGRFNEYIVRFNDGDIREYRKFKNDCPEYLYSERYNELKQKINYELQLPNKTFYSVTYNQPSGSIKQESYCSEYGTKCTVTTYIYDKEGNFKKKEVTITEPCVEIELEGKKIGVQKVTNL